MFDERELRDAWAAAIASGLTMLGGAPDEPLAEEDAGGVVLLLVQFFIISFFRSLYTPLKIRYLIFFSIGSIIYRVQLSL